MALAWRGEIDSWNPFKSWINASSLLCTIIWKANVKASKHKKTLWILHLRRKGKGGTKKYISRSDAVKSCVRVLTAETQPECVALVHLT